MENLCLASAPRGSVLCPVLETWVMGKTMVSERLFPWLICSSLSLLFDASLVKDRSLYVNLFVESKSRDSEITADNGADNYDYTKHPGAENSYFPEERMNDGEEWSGDEDEDEDDDIGQQGSGNGGDDNQDEDDGDDSDDDSNEYDEDIGDESEECEEEEEEDCDDIAYEEGTDDESLKRKAVEDVNVMSGKRYRAETSRGHETEDSSEQHELEKRYEAMEAMHLQINQNINDFYQKYNDFWPTIDDRIDVLLRKHHAIAMYIDKVCDVLRSVDPTLPLTLEFSMPKIDLLDCFKDLRSRPCPPNVQKLVEGEAQQNINVASSNTRKGPPTLNDKVEDLELQTMNNFRLLQDYTQWLDNSCQRADDRLVNIEKMIDNASTLLNAKCNDLRMKGYNIPLWDDDFITPTTSEEVLNAVNKDSATLPSNPPSSF